MRRGGGDDSLVLFRHLEYLLRVCFSFSTFGLPSSPGIWDKVNVG